MTRWIDTPEVAKLVRAALKAAYPTVKFSVRSSRYSGGSSVDVQWTDGPTLFQVQRILWRYEGASFDGMIDLKSYHDSELDGERVRFGADFVHGQRRISIEVARRMADHVRTSYAVDHVPEPKDSKYEGFFDYEPDNRFGNYTVADFVMQQCYAYDATTGMIYDNIRDELLPLSLEERYAKKEAAYQAYERARQEEREAAETCDEFAQYAFSGE